MTDWHCPKCNMKVEAIANAVGHRCPANKTRWVLFVPVPGQETLIGSKIKP